MDAVNDIVDQDEWNPSHGMIDKSWAERNALEAGGWVVLLLLMLIYAVQFFQSGQT